jgi:hypothetical protein
LVDEPGDVVPVTVRSNWLLMKSMTDDETFALSTRARRWRGRIAAAAPPTSSVGARQSALDSVNRGNTTMPVTLSLAVAAELRVDRQDSA